MSSTEAGAHFNPRIVQKAQLRPDDYDQFPSYTFREEPVSAVAGRVLIGLIGLILPALIIGWFGLRTLRRYQLAG